MKVTFLFSLALLFSALSCDGYNILVSYPFPSRSHNNLGNGVIRHLLKAGHNVTYITAYPLSYKHPNFRQIDVSTNSFAGSFINIHDIMLKKVNLNDEYMRFQAVIDTNRQTLTNENVKKFLSNPEEQFDVVVAEWMFAEVYAGLAALFDCPLIWTLPYETYTTPLRIMDDAPNPAYLPDLGSSNTPPFSFTQRIQELWTQIYSIYLKEMYFVGQEREVYKLFEPFAAARGKTMPEFDAVRYNASLMFSNTHVSLAEAQRLPQSFKSIAGYFIDEEGDPLPENLKKIMDNAKHGVIYFSMGSILKSKELSDSLKKDLVKLFSEMKETVIWKFEEVLPGLSDNVHILKWAPQQSILAHPKTKLFISHGGLLSTTETMHFGVPVIGIPVFGDQFNNVIKAEAMGYAKKVDLTFNLVNDLRDAIKEVFTDPKYKNRVKELSLVYHDRPVSPGKELVHWTEHVVRTRGAPHLRSPALLVPWYQKLYLDLAALVLTALYLILFVVKRALAVIFPKKKTVTGKRKMN